MAQRFHDNPRYWRTPLMPDAELLTAEYYAQAFAPHWHETFSIPVIQAGAQSYLYRGTTRIAGVGYIAAINPGEVHTGERHTDFGWASRAFYPTAAWMRQLASDITGRKAGVPWLPNDVIHDAEVAAGLARAHRLLEAGGDPLAAQTALTAAFALLITRHGRTRPEPAQLHPDAARVEALKARLAADLCEPLSLAELASSVDLSPFHVARLFSRMTGMPPHAWRNQLRLNSAQALLRQGMRVSDAAAATGFTDQSHFTRHFKRAYGVAPGRWQAG
ncbi:MAG TPA: AraC family transcriptional regulator [Paucimonas sp.]|nr:AraC family transcriptional regulator [Paucimonas sp.]